VIRLLTWHRAIVIVIALVSLPALSCFADGEVNALLTLKGTEGYAALEEILVSSGVLSLEDRDIDVFVLSAGTQAPPPDASPQALGALAAEYLADFVLISEYKLSGETITFEFAWYDTAEEAVTFRETGSGKVDLTLDRVIDEIINGILDTVADRIAAVRGEDARTVEAERAAASFAVGAPVSSTDTDEDASSAEPSDGPATAAVQVDAPSADPPAVPATAPPGALPSEAAPSASPKVLSSLAAASQYEAPAHFLDISAGFGVFLAVGNTGDYATTGYHPAIRVSYPINLPLPGYLSVGLETGINLLDMSGSSLAARAAIIPLGVEVKFLYGTGSFIIPYAWVSGGPAFFMLMSSSVPADDAGNGIKMKLVPYGTVGIGAAANFGRTFGMTFGVGYTLYFESSLIVMGLTPALMLHFRV
jgi:hypothetical protein